MEQSTKDMLAGFFSGWIQVLIMQPFQLVKIRLQSQPIQNPHYKGVFDCFKKIFREEGPISFYKGTLTPLIGIGFQVSSMFFTFQWAKRYFSQFKQNPNDRLPMQYVMASGFLAGIPTGLVAGPVEHARIRVQIQKGQGTNLQYQGSFDAAKKILKNYGLKGLFKGVIPAVMRQSIGQIFYFGAYQSILRASVRKDQKTTQAPVVAQILGGATAGVVFFSTVYPLDYVKTMIQTDELDSSKKKFRSINQTFNYLIKQKGGVKGLYRGVFAAYLRAAAVNAGGFPAFQGALNFLGREEAKH